MAKTQKKTAATKQTVAHKEPTIELSNMAKVTEWANSDEHKALSTSEKIRQLTAMGYTRSEVATGLGIIYQHVRNVLTTPLKRPVKTKEA